MMSDKGSWRPLVCCDRRLLMMLMLNACCWKWIDIENRKRRTQSTNQIHHSSSRFSPVSSANQNTGNFLYQPINSIVFFCVFSFSIEEILNDFFHIRREVVVKWKVTSKIKDNYFLNNDRLICSRISWTQMQCPFHQYCFSYLKIFIRKK